jgi:hypothetical protein
MSQFLLFLGEKDSASKKAFELRDELLDIVQYPTAGASHPDWLTGVPTLVCLKTQNLYRGTKCLEFLTSRQRKKKAIEVVEEMPPLVTIHIAKESEAPSPKNLDEEGVLFID